MGSGQTKHQAKSLLDDYVGQVPDDAADVVEGDSRTTYSVKRAKTAHKIVKGVYQAAQDSPSANLHLEDAKTLLTSMGIKDENGILGELLAEVVDGDGKIKLKEFEDAIHHAAEIEEDAEYLQYEVAEETAMLRNMFEEMMEMLRWCDVWTQEQKKTFISHLEKPKLNFVVDARDECGNTMLIVATMGRQLDVIKLLLGHNANPNLQNVSGFCPLHYSCSLPNPYSEEALAQNLEITRLLLESGATSDLCEGTAGCTPLHYAASANNTKATELLVQHGSKVGIRCINGFLAEEYARAAGFEDLANFLATKLKESGESTEDTSGEALQGWQEHTDNATGRVFYYNHTTGESSWTKPEEQTGEKVRQRQQSETGLKTSPDALNNPAEAEVAPANKDVQEVWSRSEYQEGCKRVIEKADTKVRETVLENLEKQASELAVNKFNEEREAMQRQIDFMKSELEKAQAKAMREEQLRLDLQNKSKEADEKFAKEYETLKQQLLQNQSSEEDTENKLAQLKSEFEEAKKNELERVKREFEEQKRGELQELERQQKEALRQREEEITKEKVAREEMEKVLLKEQEQRKKYYNEVEDLKGTIRVYARARPISKSETERGCAEVTNIHPTGTEITIQYTKESSGRGEGKEISKTFGFDQCFGSDSTQEAVFADTKRLMQSAVDGYNVCIFAYGQTGAGKTYTMTGADPADDPSGTHLGIMPRAVNELYRVMDSMKKRFGFKLAVYMCELYLDNLVDLLSPISDASQRPKLVVKKDRKGIVYVENITMRDVESKEQLAEIIKEGQAHRRTTATKMNSESSRSHLVCSIVISSENLKNQVKSSGKLTLVDLAGSERSAKTGAKGDTLKEGTSINKSLTALGDVIGALSSGQKHVPYRNHILTQLMQDSLGGNAKTLMFVNVSPADYNAEETIASLNFAARCKTVTNNAAKDLETKEIAALRREIENLKKQRG